MDPFTGITTWPDTLNPYLYSLNNPVNLVDPSGRNPFIIALFAAGLLGGVIGIAAYSFDALIHHSGWHLKCAAISGAEGAIAGMAGFLASFFLPVGATFWGALAGGMLAGLASGIAGQLTINLLTGQSLFNNLGRAAVGGMISGGIGGVISWGAKPLVRFVGHHSIPRQILNILPEDIANAVRGKAGAPNIWPIPEDLHLLIHNGPGPGGYYNAVWREAIMPLLERGNITEAEVYAIRDQLVNAFGIRKYRP